MRRKHAAMLLVATAFLCSCGAELREPLPDTSRRVTPLSFGVFVTPDSDQNPIDPPERFTGYHAATDFEVSAAELNQVIPVFAVCTGTVLFSGYIDGYGGTLIQNCSFDNQPVNVLYGHLLIESLPDKDTQLRAGDRFAELAPARSRDSGFTRKHLHLGIHKGEELSYLGYVQHEDDLENFLNPGDVIPLPILSRVLPNLTPYWQQ